MTIRETYNIIQDNIKEWNKIKTIEEFDEFDKKYKLELRQKRFFVGIDYKNPKAFGIYRDLDTGNVVLYKNKDTGERAIRYEGPNETYAVKELKAKFLSELANRMPKGSKIKTGFDFPQKAAIIIGLYGVFFGLCRVLHIPMFLTLFLGLFAAAGLGTVAIASIEAIRKRTFDATLIFLLVWGLMFGSAPFLMLISSYRGNGYYTVNDDVYYQNTSNWYYFDREANKWVTSNWDYSTYGDYQQYKTFSNNSVESFFDSEFYNDWPTSNGSNNGTNNSDSSYDYSNSYDNNSGGSWDSDWSSSDTDWGSDW